MMRALLALAFVPVTLCGAEYVRKSDPGPSHGYSDKPMGDDEFSVVATRPANTPMRRVAEMALLRAADLTREQGRTHFVIVKSWEQTSPLLGEPTAILFIRVLPGDAAAATADPIDAAEVIAALADSFE